MKVLGYNAKKKARFDRAFFSKITYSQSRLALASSIAA